MKDFRLIREKLIARTEEIVNYLYPNAKKDKSRYLLGNLDGDSGKSLNIELSGSEKGCYYDFATGEGGDIFDMWGYKNGLDTKRDFKEITQQMCERFSIENPFEESTVVKESVDLKEEKIKDESLIEKSTVSKNFHNYEWKYLDEVGNVYCINKRINLDGGKKRFLPMLPDGSYKAPEKRILYNLPFVLKSNKVFFVEGEKCADAVTEAGLCGTCIFGGANTDLNKVDFSPLEDKEIIIWRDNDEAGLKFQNKLKDFLISLGICRDVLTLKIPKHTPEKYDAYDVKESGVDIKKYIEKNGYNEGIIQAMSWFDSNETDIPEKPYLDSLGIMDEGGMVVIGGEQKVGKSFFILSMLMNFACGRDFLGTFPNRPLKTFYFQNEIEETFIRHRVKDIADSMEQTRIKEHMKNLVFTRREAGFLFNDEGASQLERSIKRSFGQEKPDIICIDPIANVFYGDKSSGSNENSHESMMAFLKRVDEMRKRVNPKAVLILLHHVKKLSDDELQGKPFQAFRGTSALAGYYTTGMILAHHESAKGYKRLFFEARNAKPIDDKVLTTINMSKWIDVDEQNVPKESNLQQKKAKYSSLRRSEEILERLLSEAKEGRMFTIEAFCSRYGNVDGIGSEQLLNRTIRMLSIRGVIKYTDKTLVEGHNPEKGHLLVVKGMMLKSTPVTPTHESNPSNGLKQKIRGEIKWEELSYDDDTD